MGGLEDRLTALERSTTLTLEDFGNYKNRTDEELKLMESQISRLLDVINDVLSTLDNQEGILRAKNLQRRLKNNYTRIRIRLWTNLKVKWAERYARKDNDGFNLKPRHYRHLHYAYSSHCI